MRAFKNTWFSKYANKNEISDEDLKDVVNILESGQADADLGGGVYKVRFARKGEGKRGGYRFIVFFKSADLMFFEYGFEKSKRANIGKRDLKYYKELAKDYLAMTDEQLAIVVKAGKFEEIGGNENEISK